MSDRPPVPVPIPPPVRPPFPPTGHYGAWVQLWLDAYAPNSLERKLEAERAKRFAKQAKLKRAKERKPATVHLVEESR